MANPLMGMMGGIPTAQPQAGNMPDMGMIQQMAQSAKRMMGMLNTVKNPQQALMQVAQQNPQLNAVMQMCQGRNPKEVFVEQCKAHGLNPDETMKQIQSMMST